MEQWIVVSVLVCSFVLSGYAVWKATEMANARANDMRDLVKPLANRLMSACDKSLEAMHAETPGSLPPARGTFVSVPGEDEAKEPDVNPYG